MHLRRDGVPNRRIDLHSALERDEFSFPIFELTGGAVTGAEALLRSRHPTRGVVQPDA